MNEEWWRPGDEYWRDREYYEGEYEGEYEGQWRDELLRRNDSPNPEDRKSPEWWDAIQAAQADIQAALDETVVRREMGRFATQLQIAECNDLTYEEFFEFMQWGI